MRLFPLVLCLLMLLAPEARAHKPSDSYLRLHTQENTVQAQWDIALRDLDIAIGLDDNYDAKITWKEVHTKRAQLEDLLRERLQLSADKAPCPLTFSDLMIDNYSDGAYAVFRFAAACAKPPEELTVTDHFLFDLDAQHKNLVSLASGEYTQSTILSADLRSATLATTAPGIWKQFREYARQGMVHIWLGYDHLLFLLALLLPAAWVYRRGVLRTDLPFKTVFWETFGFVTAFTLAHALTLALAMFNLIHVPSRLTESLIALTIAVSCINNLHSFLKQRLWLLTFAFGLIHGMGFATTLGELGLSADARWVALVAFNVGVELGQLAVVAILLPIFFTIREHPAYRWLIVRALSCVILALSLIWFLQRAFGVIIITALWY